MHLEHLTKFYCYVSSSYVLVSPNDVRGRAISNGNYTQGFLHLYLLCILIIRLLLLALFMVFELAEHDVMGYLSDMLAIVTILTRLLTIKSQKSKY